MGWRKKYLGCSRDHFQPQPMVRMRVCGIFSRFTHGSRLADGIPILETLSDKQRDPSGNHPSRYSRTCGRGHESITHSSSFCWGWGSRTHRFPPCVTPSSSAPLRPNTQLHSQPDTSHQDVATPIPLLYTIALSLRISQDATHANVLQLLQARTPTVLTKAIWEAHN